jgi:hypothetical protein
MTATTISPTGTLAIGGTITGTVAIGMFLSGGGLTANTYYPIRIMFGQNYGGFIFSLNMIRPDGTSFTNGQVYFFNKKLSK